MNFIKKKLKGHKKDDEEEEYEKAVAEQSLNQGTRSTSKNTEEWQFFQQLSMKVQDTVSKTQTSLNKLKDNRQDSKDGNDFDECVIPEYPGYDMSSSYGKQPIRAPPRPPPPPAGDQSWFSAPESELSGNLSYKDPGNVIPDLNAFSDNSAFHGLHSSKPASSPARPPPPRAATDTFTQGTNGTFSQPFQSNSATIDTSMSLLDEFGFQPVVSAPTTNTRSRGFQDLLFMDVKEGADDPFDTSFVNVEEIVPPRNSAANGTKSEDIRSNPFSVSANPKYIERDESELQNNRKKNITNPFFATAAMEQQEEPKAVNGSLWSSHNPFSSSQPPPHPPPPVAQDNNDLLGLEFFGTDNKGFDDTFPAKEVNLMDAFGDDDAPNPEPVLNPIVTDRKPSLSSNLAFNHDIADRFSQAWASDDTSDVISVFPETIQKPESPVMKTSIQWDTADSPEEPLSTMEPDGVDNNIPTERKSSIISEGGKSSIHEELNNSYISDERKSSGQEDSFGFQQRKNSTHEEIMSSPVLEEQNSVHEERRRSILEEQKALAAEERRCSVLEEQNVFAQEERRRSILTERQNSIQEERRRSILEEHKNSAQDERNYAEVRKPSIQEERRTPVGSRKSSIHEERRTPVGSRKSSIHEEKRTPLGSRTSSTQEQTPVGSRKSSIHQERMNSIHLQESMDMSDSPDFYAAEPMREIASEPTNYSTSMNEAAAQENLNYKMEQNERENFGHHSAAFEDTAYSTDQHNYNEEMITKVSNVENSPSEKATEPEDGFTTEAVQSADDMSSFSYKETVAQPNYDFDAFAAKFESAWDTPGANSPDPFASGKAPSLRKIKEGKMGFDSMDEFDPFKGRRPVPPRPPPLAKAASKDSFDDYDTEADFSIVIKPKMKDSFTPSAAFMEAPKLLPPPPKTPTKTLDLNSLRFNPFDKDFAPGSEQASQNFKKAVEPEYEDEQEPIPALGEAGVLRKTDSLDSPLTPLFDDDTSQPLEVFPKPFPHEGYEMVLRQPNKKKLTGNRFWKKIFLKVTDTNVLQLFNKSDDKLPFQELPLQACYSLSEVSSQQYDQYGKIFTVKVQYKFYRERVGVRAGQVSKVIQGQVTSMGDVARLGLPLQHTPQTSQLLKLGTHSYADIKYFMQDVEDCLFRIAIHRDRVLTYKSEEIQVVAQDVFYVEQSKTGHVDKQLARVGVFFLAFITGMPSVEVGLNDITRQGKEVVGRYDILPVITEEWIRLEDIEFHSCVIQEEFYKTRTIKFQPPDACLFELLRFRIRPPKNRELPLQVRVFMTVTSSRVEIRSDILVPGYSSRKQGQIPCENIQIRFPIPECWIYLFRTEKHFRYGSKKSTSRRPGKIKGLERIIGAAQNLDPSLIEVSAGQAKYEHVFHAVVWRIPRLPKEGQGAYTQQLFLLRTELTSFDQIPDSFEQYVDVEFTMPATYVSHTTVRSISVTNPEPPEKYVRYISKHEYKVEIEFKSADEMEGLVSSPSNVQTTSAPPAVHKSTVEENEEDSD